MANEKQEIGYPSPVNQANYGYDFSDRWYPRVS